MSATALRAELHHGIDTALPLAPAQNYFQLAGWAFVAGASRRCPVRVVVGDQVFTPMELTDRTDVGAQFPDEPAATQSGFRFIGYLPFGFHLGTLEISAGGNDWRRLRPLAIPVSSHPILGAIEKPAASEVITKPVRIEGWCFHPEFTVAEIVLQFGNVEVPCETGLARPDVAARFPAHPAAARSGFITSENLPRGEGPVKIRAQTSCGRVYFISSTHRVEIRDGFVPKPPPPSPLKNLSTLRIDRARARRPRHPGTTEPRGARNILFALYGDFSANSALHVAALANELNRAGCDCVVAVPDHKETVGALPRGGFPALNFDELDDLPTLFRDGLGPQLVHGWTSRENVRKFCAEVAERFGSDVFVHLEDNEQDILETRLQRPYAELAALPDAELDALVPDVLSHPRRASRFLQEARGVTTIVERLKEHVPAGVPTHVIWPAADADLFRPLPRDEDFRRRLGFRPDDVVLFYHGNTHTSNAAEMRSLYEAVVLLNERGVRTQLVRTGRDFPDFLPEGDAWIRPYLVQVGHVGRAKRLPQLMAIADIFVQPGSRGAFNDYRFPSKLPEFFAIGRPVVLPPTNLGNIVRHGEDAWVLENGDAAAIADAVAQIHRQPELAARLARGATEFSARHFSWSRSARGLLAFYQSLTALTTQPSS